MNDSASVSQPPCRRWAYIVSTMLLLALVALGLFVPVHDDEIGWSYSSNRAIHDGYKITSIWPSCNSYENTTLALPLSWYPHAAFTGWLYGQQEGVLGFRLIGLLRFVLLMLPLVSVSQ